MVAASGRQASRLMTPSEFAADRIVHLVGLVAGVVGATALIAVVAVRGGFVPVVTVAAYSIGLLAMLSFSTAYNLSAERNWPRTDLLRRFDHAAIFFMIAGTYTPFTILGLQGGWAIGMTIAVWAIAAVGIALKLATPSEKYPFVSTLLYLAFGWIGVIAIGPLSSGLSVPILALLALGGVLYSIGSAFHSFQGLRYQRAIWHGFVVAAAAVHFTAVLAFAGFSG